ncbi:MAG: HAD-IA family hydrolase [Candidatus Cloacimonas sp.]
MKPFLLFDFDGTIANSIQLGMKIANELAPQFGYKPISEDDFKRYSHLPWHKIIKEMHLPYYRIPKLILVAFAEYNRQIRQIKPCEGILEMLKELSEMGIPMALLSSNTVENVQLFLQQNGINSFLWVEGTSGILNKAREIKQRIQKHKLDPQNVIYVGDEIRDIESSHKCGLKIISVTWGFHSAEFLSSYNPDYLVNAPQEIIDIVRGL